MSIYFNTKKEAHGYEIENPICIIEKSLWDDYCTSEVGIGWDIIDGEFTPLTSAESIRAETLSKESEGTRRSLYEYADEQIAKCDNYILLNMNVEEYTQLKRDWLQYKMAVRETQNHEDFPFNIEYPPMPTDNE